MLNTKTPICLIMAFMAFLSPSQTRAFQPVPILIRTQQADRGIQDPKVEQHMNGTADSLLCIGNVHNSLGKAIYTNCRVPKEYLTKTPLQAFLEGVSFCASEEQLRGPNDFKMNRLPQAPTAEQPKGLIIDHFIPSARLACASYCFQKAWLDYEVKKENWIRYGQGKFREFIEANEPYNWKGESGHLLDKAKKSAVIRQTGQACSENDSLPLEFPIAPVQDDEQVGLILDDTDMQTDLVVEDINMQVDLLLEETGMHIDVMMEQVDEHSAMPDSMTEWTDF